MKLNVLFLVTKTLTECQAILRRRLINMKIFALLACLMCGTAHATLDSIVALVNNGAITDSQLAQTSELLRRQNPNLAGEPLRKAALERLIMRALQQQEAERLGISVDEATLDRGMEQLARRNNLGISDFRQQAEAEGMRWDTLRENVRDEITLQRLRESAILRTITVNDNEINEFLDNNREQLVAKQYALERFSVPFPASDTARNRAELERQVRRVVSALQSGGTGEQILSVLRAESVAVSGGAIGWRTLDQLPPPLRSVTAELEVGGFSDPLPDAEGVHLFRLTDTRDNTGAEITRTRARHIVLRSNPVRDDDATRAQLLEFREHLQRNGSFAELAERHSEDYSSALVGGLLPWFGPGEMAPEFENAVSTLPEGNVSAPIRTAFGWHLVEVLERKREDVSDERLRNETRERIAQEKLLRETERYLQRLRDEAFLEFPDAS